MPRIWVSFAALPVMVAVAGAGGWLRMKPTEPARGPDPKQPPPGDPHAPTPPGPGADPKAPALPAPKLVVLVVFDQMRGDYLARWAPHFGADGFYRMKKGGVWFSECHVPY